MAKNSKQTKIIFWISLTGLVFIAILLNIREFLPKKIKKDSVDEMVETSEEDSDEVVIQKVEKIDKSSVKENNVTNYSDFKSLLTKSRFTLVKFGASWCKYCKNIENDFNSIKSSDNLNIISLDRDACSEVFSKMEIVSMPTFILFEGDQILKKWIGSDKIQDVKSFINEEKWKDSKLASLDNPKPTSTSIPKNIQSETKEEKEMIKTLEEEVNSLDIIDLDTSENEDEEGEELTN